MRKPFESFRTENRSRSSSLSVSVLLPSPAVSLLGSFGKYSYRPIASLSLSCPKICDLHPLIGIHAQPPSNDRQLLAGKQGHRIEQVAPVQNQVYPPVHWKAHQVGKIVHWKARQSHIALVHNQTNPSLISSRCSSCRAIPSFRSASTTRWHFLVITQNATTLLRLLGCHPVDATSGELIAHP